MPPAAEQIPEFHQSLGGLALSLLEIEQYEKTLEACDRARAIGPVCPEAIDEPGEVFLGLDRIDAVKASCTELMRVDRPEAGKVMSAMNYWGDQRRGDAGELPEDVIESFAAWIQHKEPVDHTGPSVPPKQNRRTKKLARRKYRRDVRPFPGLAELHNPNSDLQATLRAPASRAESPSRQEWRPLPGPSRNSTPCSPPVEEHGWP